MKKVIYVILVLIVLGLIVTFNKKDPVTQTTDTAPEETVTNEQAATFTGTISTVDTGCFADAVCSVTVDGKKVILVTGMRLGAPEEVGTLKGVASIGDLEAKIGSSAKVYAAKTTDGEYTLYGNTDYYVEVL
jgi:hypothetical protein